MDQEWTGNGVGMDWEQIRNETPFPGMDRSSRNGLGIHQESRNEPGVHKEWWGSVKFWLNTNKVLCPAPVTSQEILAKFASDKYFTLPHLTQTLRILAVHLD
jgi:hypothetical protein